MYFAEKKQEIHGYEVVVAGDISLATPMTSGTTLASGGVGMFVANQAVSLY
jgi:hypothetical protein